MKAGEMTSRPAASPSSLATILRFVRACVDGLVLRCPRCHRGCLFPGFFTYKMARQCPRCGLAFEPDEGEVTGGMGINMVLTSILGVPVMIWGVLFSGLPIGLVLAGLALFVIVFGLWFHRHARGLWVGVLFATGSLLPTSGSSDPARAVRLPRVR
jgi:uncharacterized protein (DUF983 family)